MDLWPFRVDVHAVPKFLFGPRRFLDQKLQMAAEKKNR